MSFALDELSLKQQFRAVRELSHDLCATLEPEDCVVQSMPDVSPTRWHLAHTTWFFEKFVLEDHVPGYRTHHPEFNYLFNSYYNSVGNQFPRPQRGLLSRPTVREVWQYRQAIDEQIAQFLDGLDQGAPGWSVIQLGIQHEQQHQELMLTDIKHVFSCNPLLPGYQGRPTWPVRGAPALRWHSCPRQLTNCGFEGDGFAYDNERPRHEQLLHPFCLASRLVTNREYLEFVNDAGYQDPRHWLSLGWSIAQQENWTAPLYWQRRDGEWHEFTLCGLQPLMLDAPVCHVSLFEADAYARWAGRRLPTEFEWEVVAAATPRAGNFLAQQHWHPIVAEDGPAAAGPRLPDSERCSELGTMLQMWGDVWEWTGSAYLAYPGYQPQPGALGEYNGKFMCNQYVLRGGSCVTSANHVRASYRNFFPPQARWQFTGFRLADQA